MYCDTLDLTILQPWWLQHRDLYYIDFDENERTIPRLLGTSDFLPDICIRRKDGKLSRLLNFNGQRFYTISGMSHFTDCAFWAFLLSTRPRRGAEYRYNQTSKKRLPGETTKDYSKTHRKIYLRRPSDYGCISGRLYCSSVNQY
jgi:hypothetical protein